MKGSLSWETAAGAVGLLAVLLACRPAAQADREELRQLLPYRWVEPRLTGGFAWQPCTEAEGGLVEAVSCPGGPELEHLVSISPEDDPHVSALRILVLTPDKTDEAVTALESLAGASPPKVGSASDLAAAYLVRAQRDGQPLDLLRAHAAAERAVDQDETHEEALFNLALAEEKLGLPGAEDSWRAFLAASDDAAWSAEARLRLDRLEREALQGAAMAWPLNRERLRDPVVARDREAISGLIAPYPAAAQRYVEEEVLPAWAHALGSGNRPQAARALALAEAVAGELERHTKDSYLKKVVGAMVEAAESEDPERIATLRRGVLAFAAGREAERAKDAAAAGSHFAHAGEELGRARCPLRYGAQLGRAISSWPADGEHVARLLAPLEDEARSNGFHNLLARSLAMRALVRVYQSRYVESLDLYDEAGRIFTDMRDGENVVRISTRKVGVLRTFGQIDAAWKEAFQALRAAQAIEAEERHHLLGEAAAAARALGYPRVALRFQDAAVEMLRQELAATSEGRDSAIRGLRANLAIALQHRGLIHVDLGDDVRAERDLQEALVLGGEVTDETILRTFQARVWEARARAQSITDPAAALGAFETALKLVPPHEHLTFRADLWFQRAKAWQRPGDDAAAERDLKRGIEELRAEERRLLQHRRLGQAEAAWTPYFSRFREAYETLIRLLLDREEVEEAFFYAERVRGYEPLDLVLRLPTTKEVFGKLAQSHEPMSLHEIRRRLPAGTWLVEFLVLADRIVTWVVSSAGVEVLELPLETATLAGWVATVQAKAESRDAEGLAAVLAEPYSSLIREPLAAIARRHGPEAIERLVFVPDGLLHGLPFAALYDRGRGRYLVEDYPVAVAPSATLYVISLDRDARLSEAPARASALLVGDPAFDRSSRLAAGLPRLPRAAREVRRISDLYRPDALILTEEQATLDRFLALAPKSTVVHFAGHAVVNPAAPFRSLLLFAPSPAHSGAVSAEELLTDLRAHHTRLFILAACSSSGGHPIGPEGLSPLVRPLFAAGVPAVLGSLWNIGDHTTEELLVEFHRQYTAGKDAAVALRAAQRHLQQRRGGAGSVLAWAPFQVIGHSASPFPERSP